MIERRTTSAAPVLDAMGVSKKVRTSVIGPTPEMASHAEQKLASGDGFALIFQSRYLTLIAALIVLLNVVNSTGEFMLGDLVSNQAHALHPGNVAAQKQFVGTFYPLRFDNGSRTKINLCEIINRDNGRQR